MDENGRDTKGRFAPGNKGGPGRPRRAVERDYLAKLSDNISLEDWGQIVLKAVQDAKSGDAKAREFVAKFVVAERRNALSELAAKESVGLSVRHELVDAAHIHRADHIEMMGLRMKTSPAELFEKLYPIKVGELASDSSTVQNAKPKQATSPEFKNDAVI